MKLINRSILTMVMFLLAAGSAMAFTERLGNDYVDFNHRKTLSKTADYTVTTNDDGALINCDATSADVTATLPLISDVFASGKSMAIKILKTDSGTNTCDFAPATGDTVGGESARMAVNQNGYVIIQSSSGRDWNVTFESPYVVEDHEAGTVNFNGLNSTELASSTVIVGTTPYLGIGDAGAEDTKLYFDGAAQDYHMGLDDTDDVLKIGLGTAVGTTPAISVNASLESTFYADVTVGGTTPVVTIGDAGAEDTALVYDGVAQDYYIALDDGTDDLLIGLGSAVGTTPALAIDENLVTTWTGGTVALAATTTAADTLTVAECGKTIFLNNATGYATALPTVGGATGPAGCEFTFVMQTALSSGNHTVTTGNSLENVMFGMVNHAAAVSACADEDTISFVNTALPGDWAKVVSDGTAWYVTGEAVTTNLLTCTQAD